MILTYKYKLKPKRHQHEVLNGILESQRQLYNAALEERIDCYRKTGRGVSYIDQCKSLTLCRRDLPEMHNQPLNLQRWTIKRLDEAYQGFFRRIKGKARKAGFPRFRGRDYWSSFGFNEFTGIRFDGKRIRFAGLPGGLRVHLHRELPESSNIRSCIFVRAGRRWSVCFNIAVPSGGHLNPQSAGDDAGNTSSERSAEPPLLPEEERNPSQGQRSHTAMVGLDLGISSFATLSDGSTIETPHIGKRALRELRRRSRALARCKRGSRRRRKVRERLARAHRKIANTRSTWLHQRSQELASRYDLIAAEDLKIGNMTRSAAGTVEEPGTNVRAKAGLNRSILDASWGQFLQFLTYKCERAGGKLVLVDPRRTSQICSGCGVIVRKTIAQRTHHCPECGLILDRDHNAAINILDAAEPSGKHLNRDNGRDGAEKPARLSGTVPSKAIAVDADGEVDTVWPASMACIRPFADDVQPVELGRVGLPNSLGCGGADGWTMPNWDVY